MFRLSKAAEYGVRGLLHLSLKPEGENSDIEEISKAQDVPAAYLAKLFQGLAKKGFVRSFRGPEGGFVLTKKPGEINLLEVIEAVEGPIFLNDCLIHKGYCPRDEMCPVHDVWREAQNKFLDYLRGSTFDDLARAARLKQRKVMEKKHL